MKRLFFLLATSLYPVFCTASIIESKHYNFNKTKIDVVIPVTEKDLPTLDLCIKGIRKHCKDVRRIVTVSNKRLTDEAEWYPEKKFPFTKSSINKTLLETDSNQHNAIRTGWIIQQLIKLYAGFIIPNLSDNYLVLDSDTIFLQDIEFQSEKGWPLFNTSDQYHLPYFNHMYRLLPGLKKVCPHSGITHHMLLQKDVLKHLFYCVRKAHKAPFWKAFLRTVTPNKFSEAPVSEYEIYINFLMSTSNQYILRRLNWAEVPLNKFSEKKKKNYDYLSCHAHLG